MKQTVEEIAKMLLAIANDEQGVDGEEERGFLIGAASGINWQKEQGIEWINVSDGLPKIKESKDGEWLLIWDGGANAPTVAFFDLARKRFIRLSQPLYYAYINLPK